MACFAGASGKEISAIKKPRDTLRLVIMRTVWANGSSYRTVAGVGVAEDVARRSSTDVAYDTTPVGAYIEDTRRRHPPDIAGARPTSDLYSTLRFRLLQCPRPDVTDPQTRYLSLLTRKQHRRSAHDTTIPAVSTGGNALDGSRLRIPARATPTPHNVPPNSTVMRQTLLRPHTRQFAAQAAPSHHTAHPTTYVLPRILSPHTRRRYPLAAT